MSALIFYEQIHINRSNEQAMYMPVAHTVDHAYESHVGMGQFDHFGCVTALTALQQKRETGLFHQSQLGHLISKDLLVPHANTMIKSYV